MRSDVISYGGEERESNPPETVKASTKDLKSSGATGPHSPPDALDILS